ncbi:hypothetical protein ABH935_008458 [Catenulispora sp. GAS73]
MIEGRYDVAELGLTYFLRTFDPDDPRYRAGAVGAVADVR